MTLMINVTGIPVQPPALGVTVIVPVCTVAALAALKLRFPLPEAGKPIAGLLFVQLKVGPPVPEKPTLTASLAQTVTSAGSITVGSGLTVIVNVSAGPGQAPPGVTVIVPVWVVATPAALKFRLPVPEAPRPIAGLLLVHEKEGALPVNMTLIGSPAQAVSSAGWLTEVAGLMVIVKVLGVPGQPPFCGVTVMVATCCVRTDALGKLIFPEPEAPSPMAGLLFVQEKVGVPVPVKFTFTGLPPQAT